LNNSYLTYLENYFSKLFITVFLMFLNCVYGLIKQKFNLFNF
jgi:hypothetical protein